MMMSINHPNVDKDFIVHLYRQIILRAKAMGLPATQYDIHGRAMLLNTIFGSDTEIDIDGQQVKIIRDNKITERAVSNGAFETDLYLVDRDMLKANEDAYDEPYRLGLLIL